MNPPIAPTPADPGALNAAENALVVDEAPGLAEARRNHIASLRKELTQARKHDEEARKQYAKDRAVANGESVWLVDTNLVQTIIEIIMAFVYAKDPDIAATVAPSVGESRAKNYAPMTETLEIVVSRLLKKAHLKKKAKKLARAAMTTGIGWLKATMQTRTERDTVIQNQINDLKEQLDNVAALQAMIASGECANEDVARSRIQANMTALQAKAERVIALGLVLDVMDCNDIQVSPQCGMLEDYLDAPWITQRFYKSKEQVLALTKWTDDEAIKRLAHANRYHQKMRAAQEADGTTGTAKMEWARVETAATESIEGFYLIEEVWHREDGVIYTLIDGCSDYWAREPYAPRQSSRFYDLFRLAFHDIDGQRHPQSDVKMLSKLQNEYASIRSNFAEHRKRSIPATIFDAEKINDTEAKKLSNAEIGEYIGLRGMGDVEDMRKLFANKSYAQFDPSLYNTQQVLTDIEKVSGAQDAMQSSVAVEKTATEAEIQNNGFGARIGTRKDALEDLLSELAVHTAELAMQVCDEKFVQRLAGDQAVWPALTIDEIMYGFDIEVSAGSTGKPNTAAMRNAWSTLLPLIEKMITVIGNFRAQGPQMEWAAQPYIALLKETFRRLDQRFDVEKFLPQAPPPQPVIDPATGLPAVGPDGRPVMQTPGTPVDPATGAPGPVMTPTLSATGGVNAATPPPAAASPAPATA